MNRAKTGKGQLSRSRLLQAAAAEFAANGFHRTKISDIVRRAGLTQAAFYLYFPSKEAVWLELVSPFCERLRQIADAGRDVTPLAGADVIVQVRENLARLFRFLAERPEVTKIALFETDEGEAIKREIVAMVQANLVRNQAAGHVRRELSPEVAAECMVAVMERLTARYLLSGEKDAEQLADEAVTFITHGILRVNG
ncbi:TetR/AcrR family transcriptional regulator [Brevibacillus sp. LEMMJ03]|uniref:TetR/AcrR family transcriptional regulator n=1 Tax=Brevibacillus sp. LEMMJ03 TaxID=2595056 RepID=UPI00117CC9EA|nr:TetR/AcrR family transcriptional regulator [Brevibacillus sp. LEMMJ03]TRY27546.1 TetR/AcrR family transcriptional regulator [Brevibacillus sp. LEMMJ03]